MRHFIGGFCLGFIFVQFLTNAHEKKTLYWMTTLFFWGTIFGGAAWGLLP